MPHELINHSPDLKKLWDEGYDLQIQDCYLLMSHVPYVISTKQVAYGTLVSDLSLAGDRTVKPGNHVAHFTGDPPCDKDGRVLSAIVNATNRQQLSPTIVINCTFSSKPRPEGYVDYYEKMTTYAAILSTQAQSVDPHATARTFQVTESEELESPFRYIDTNSARAAINMVSKKLEGHTVAIIGLGGTGSYLLDMIAKTPVKEIHLFDGDFFLQHNAFRAPGAASVETLRQRHKKVDYLTGIYANMHKGIVPHPYYIDASRHQELATVDYVFMCMEGDAKKALAEYLEREGLSFIDVGMGVHEIDGSLIGITRVTSSTKLKRDHFGKRVSAATGGNNDYSTNIQIADLNALNATLAVIKWKKLCGFYRDDEHENTTTYTVGLNQLLSEDHDPR